MQSKNEIDEIAAVHDQSEARLKQVHAEHPHEAYDDSKLLSALEHAEATGPTVSEKEVAAISKVHDKSMARLEKSEHAHHQDPHNSDTKLLNALIHEVSIDGPSSEIEKIAIVHDASLIGHQHDISDERRERKAEQSHHNDAPNNDTKLLNALEHELANDGKGSEIERIATVHEISQITHQLNEITHHIDPHYNDT
jgi:hypothetical protein